MLTRQESQTQLNYNQSPDCVIPMQLLQQGDQTVAAELAPIKFLEGGANLEIRGAIVVNKFKLPQSEKSKKNHKKNTHNSKIHSNPKENQALNQNIWSMDKHDLSEKVFCVNNSIEQLKNNCQEIIIESSDVNIYALKKLIRIVSKRLIKLKIERCTFYESDKTAILKQRFSSNNANNKMLRELSFAFQIKSIYLPEIEGIEITLLKPAASKNNIDLSDPEKSERISQKSTNEQNYKQKLVDDYECNEESSFIDFEMSTKSILENKLNKYKSQQEIASYIINGEQTDKKDVKDCINDNIVKDVQEHIHAYTKFVKGSLLTNNIFIIRGYCLEDPIAFTIIQNMMLKNKKHIEIVIFKETGTIPNESFLKVINILIQMTKLTSIAFFDSQPQFEPKPYHLLSELNDLKAFKFIVLNRTSFDLTYYRQNAFEKDKNEKELHINKKDHIQTVNPPPKHYAFYVLDTKDKSKELYEFTPYSYCICELLFPNQSFESDEQKEEAILKYEIGHLIKKQKEEYPLQINQLIMSMQNDEILTYTGINEQLLSKYKQEKFLKYYDNDYDIQVDQMELENDVRTLIKHANYFSITIAKMITRSLKQPTIRNNLLLECNLYNVNRYTPYFFDYDINRIFVKQNSLSPAIIKGDLIENTYLNNGFPVSSLSRLYKDIHYSENKSLYDSITNVDIDKFHSSINKKSVEIDLIFKDNQFLIYETLNSKYTESVMRKTLLEYNFDDSAEQIFQCDLFLKILKQIISKFCKSFPIKLKYGMELKSAVKICLQHLEQLSKCGNIKIEELFLDGDSQSLYFSPILSLLPIKLLILQSFKIDSQSFQGVTCPLNFEMIEFTCCEIESLDCSYLSNGIYLTRCEIKQSIIQKLFLDQKYKLEIMQQSSMNFKPFIFIELFNSESISPELASLIVMNESTLKIGLCLQVGREYNTFKEEILKQFPITLNPNLLQKFQGKQNAHVLFAPDVDENQEQKQKYINSSSLTNVKTREEVNIVKQRIDGKYDNQISNVCHQLSEVYSNVSTINSPITSLIGILRQKQQYSEEIGDCCTDSNTKLTNNNLNLREEIERHDSQFCFFKTSVFQVPFRPKSIQLNFFNNLNFGEPDQIFKNINQMEWIEELHFRNQTISFQNEQIKFLNLLIRLSPCLVKLSIKRIRIFNDHKKQDLFTPLQSHKALKHLELVDTMSRAKFFCLNILDAILMSESAANLETLNVHQESQFQYFNERVYQLIEKSKNTLKILKVNLEKEDEWKTVKQCSNLQKLDLWCHIINFPISQVHKMQSLKSLTICVDIPSLNQLFFNSLLDDTLKKQSLNFQQIAIRFYESYRQYQLIKYLDLWDRYHKWPTYDTYYIEIESNNNNFPRQHQILLINKCFEVKCHFQDQYTDVKINAKEYLLANYCKTIRQATVSILKEIPNIHLLSIIQELHINKQDNYLFLNNIFEVAKQTSCLTVISFDDCNLENNSLKGVDFSKLPITLKMLCIGGKNNLSSLKFLKPLRTQKQQQYQTMVLDICLTQIPLTQIIKYTPYFKRIDYKFKKLWELSRPIIQQIYPDIGQQMIAFQAMQSVIADVNIIPSEVRLHFKLILHQKLFNFNVISKQTYPFFFSQLKIMETPLELTAQENILDICAKQKEDNIFSIKKNFGNQYLFYLCSLINKSHQYILSHGRSHNDSYLHIGKLRAKKFLSKDETDFSQIQHMFFDYLLLVELSKKFNLKQVILPIELEISQELIEDKNVDRDLDELTMIEYFRKIPPSELTLDNTSIQFIKTWYVIQYISPLSYKTHIQRFNPEAIYNTSIGHFLTQNLHRNNLFRSVLSGNPLKYRFDDTVQFLAKHLEDQIAENQHAYLLGLFPLYLFVCLFGVVYFSLHFNVTCGNGISWYSYYIYLVYGFFTLWLELAMFKKCLNYISHLIPSIEIDLNPSFIISCINFIKQSIIDTPWINQWYMGYSYSFLQSQIARFDNFTNVAFLYSTYQCGDYVIFYIALSFMAIPFLYSAFQFLKMTLKPNKEFQLPTTSLDIYFNICSIIEFRAVSDILDLVSPSNVITLKGRMFNARIISFFIRIICESIPLVAIQIYNLTKRPMTSSLVLSLILSIITFISLTVSVLTITPSTLNQEDFNQLNEKKKKERVVEKYEERLQTFENEAFALRFYEYLKTLRSQSQTQKNNPDIANKYKANIDYFKKLFDSPKEQLLHSADDKDKKEN